MRRRNPGTVRRCWRHSNCVTQPRAVTRKSTLAAAAPIDAAIPSELPARPMPFRIELPYP